MGGEREIVWQNFNWKNQSGQMSVKIMNENGNVQHDFHNFQQLRVYTQYFSYSPIRSELKYVNVNIAVRWHVALFDRLSVKMAKGCGGIEEENGVNHHAQVAIATLWLQRKPPNQIKYQYRFTLTASSSKIPLHLIAYHFFLSSLFLYSVYSTHSLSLAHSSLHL